MGESRRRKLIEEAGTQLTKELTDQGKLIEAGFALFAHYVIKKAPPDQIADMRVAFMAGAQHVFSSLFNMLDHGEEPTADDMRRMDLICAELEAWRGKLAALIGLPPAALATEPKPVTAEPMPAELVAAPERLGDAPVEDRYQKMMTFVARAVDGLLNGEQKPKPNGFILMVFPFEGHEGRCNYMSNANRADVVIMLKEQIKRFEGQPDITGHA